MDMRTPFLLIGLASTAVACTSGLDTKAPRPNPNFQPGASGTLVELTDQTHQIFAMALSANYVYFAVPWAGLYRMPKYGGDVFAVQEDAHGLFDQVATNGGHVFWDYVTFDEHDFPYTRIQSQAFDAITPTTLAEGDF